MSEAWPASESICCKVRRVRGGGVGDRVMLRGHSECCAQPTLCMAAAMPISLLVNTHAPAVIKLMWHALLSLAVAAAVFLPDGQQPASCADVAPMSSPGKRFACPKLMEYDASKDGVAAPSADACCKVQFRFLLRRFG